MKHRMHVPRGVSRRAFVQGGTSLGASTLLSPLILQVTACGDTGSAARSDGSSGGASSGGAGGVTVAGAGGTEATSRTIGDGDVLLGLYAGDARSSVIAGSDRLDFSWLRQGDSVLIKVASNSGNPHPAVTSPQAVLGMIEVLEAHGAGRVIVADQAGVEWVRLSAQGRFSSTRERWNTNGLIAVEANAEVYFFDDHGFDTGYFEATLPPNHHWPRGMWLANLIREVDHIVYMPRIGQHVLAGLSLGHKMAVGFLRDDSRHDFHNDAENFYDKYTEINYTQEIASRLRLTVTAGEQILLHGGPDEGTALRTDVPVLVASNRLANHDAVASSMLVHFNAVTPQTYNGLYVYNRTSAASANGVFAGGFGVETGDAGAWVSGSPSTRYTAHAFEAGITRDVATTRGWELSGGRPTHINVIPAGRTIDPALRDAIEAHGEGLYAIG